MRQCCYFMRHSGTILCQSMSLLPLLLRLNAGLSVGPLTSRRWEPGLTGWKGLTCPAHFCRVVWHHKAWHLCSSDSTCAICFHQSGKTPGRKLVTRRGVDTHGPRLSLAGTARAGDEAHRPGRLPTSASASQVRGRVPGDAGVAAPGS